MGFFRNPEIRREMVLWGAGLAVCLFAAKLFSGSRGMVVCLFAGFLFTAAHFLSSFFRYRKIAFLSEEVERCLHGKQLMEITEQAEGELAILQTELQKMIRKLAHQAKLLQDDKIYLMNSIADISHQIRTPLTTINLIVSRLASRNLEEKTRYELLRNLEGLLQHMEWLVETLLKMAKLDAGTIQMKRTRIDVGELIERATRDLLIPMELREQKMKAEIALKESQGELHQLKTAIAAGKYIAVEEVTLDYQRFFVTFKKFAMALPTRLMDECLSAYVDPTEARRVEKQLQKEDQNILTAFVVAGVTAGHERQNRGR